MANYRNLNAKYANKLREDIKKAMDEQGILLTELADKANIEKSVLRNYINGRFKIRAEITALLGVLYKITNKGEFKLWQNLKKQKRF